MSTFTSRWLSAFTTRAPGTNSLKTELECLPPRSIALMPQSASGLVGSLGALGSRNSTGFVPSITIRPFQAGIPDSTLERDSQRTATNTMSALAASATVPALMDGPVSAISAAKEAGPRLFEMVAEIPFLPSTRATLAPRPPEPIIPILITHSC